MLEKIHLFSVLLCFLCFFFIYMDAFHLVFLTNLYPHLVIYHDHQSWDIKPFSTTLGVLLSYICLPD
jgi:hypothetical protein